MESYLRILFITPAAFNGVTGGGITFSNLFKGWSSDCLATITDDPVPVSYEICKKYYFLSQRERGTIGKPIFYIKKNVGQTVKNQIEEKVSKKSLKYFLKALVGPAGIPDRGSLTRELIEWIEEYKPEVLYTICGSIGYLDLVNQILIRYKIPLVIHLMDDGVTDPQKKGLFGKYIRKTYGRKFKALVSKAAVRIGICEEMAEEYAKRYKCPFQFFQNTIDLSDWSLSEKVKHYRNSTNQIIYIGSIFPNGQLQSLIDCAQAVEMLVEKGMRIQLAIYSPLELFGQYAHHFAQYKGVCFNDAPRSDGEFIKLIVEAKGLLLPVNFDDESIRFIRLSMPTKVPAYLASKVPILVYGPPGIAQVEYARKYKWASIVDKRNIATLSSEIERLFVDDALRLKLSQCAWDAVLSQHSADIVRKGFRVV